MDVHIQITALEFTETTSLRLPLIDLDLTMNLARKTLDDYRTDHELASVAPTEVFPKLDD